MGSHTSTHHPFRRRPESRFDKFETALNQCRRRNLKSEIRNLKSEMGLGLGQDADEQPPIRVILKNRFPPIPAIHNLPGCPTSSTLDLRTMPHTADESALVVDNRT